MSEFNSLKLEQFSGRPLLAIDYGSKVVGLASFQPGSDPFPTPFGKIIYQSDKQVCEELLIILNNECIEAIVLGLPRYEDGNESTMTKRVKSFSKLLSEMVQEIEIHFQDETFSSFAAENRMKESAQYNFKVDQKQIDAVAACIILEDFFKA